LVVVLYSLVVVVVVVEVVVVVLYYWLYSHMDMQVENVMLTDGDDLAKIIDFGLALPGDMQEGGTRRGTISCMAPEVQYYYSTISCMAPEVSTVLLLPRSTVLLPTTISCMAPEV
jgi:serine/threonine protein kinase